jgi:hypothetical protein
VADGDTGDLVRSLTIEVAGADPGLLLQTGTQAPCPDWPLRQRCPFPLCQLRWLHLANGAEDRPGLLISTRHWPGKGLSGFDFAASEITGCGQPFICACSDPACSACRMRKATNLHGRRSSDTPGAVQGQGRAVRNGSRKT